MKNSEKIVMALLVISICLSIASCIIGITLVSKISEMDEKITDIHKEFIWDDYDDSDYEEVVTEYDGNEEEIED